MSFANHISWYKCISWIAKKKWSDWSLDIHLKINLKTASFFSKIIISVDIPTSCLSFYFPFSLLAYYQILVFLPKGYLISVGTHSWWWLMSSYLYNFSYVQIFKCSIIYNIYKFYFFLCWWLLLYNLGEGCMLPSYWFWVFL
jgi:hypothetical protein